jgi:NAD(P)H dehydrogenase (quinone)
VLNGTEAAAEIAAGLGQPVHGVVLTPADLIAQVTAGAIQFPPSIEANYAASMLEWVRQTYDGLLNFGGVTTTCEDLTGRKPLTLRRWVEKNREAVLAAGRPAADGAAAA